MLTDRSIRLNSLFLVVVFCFLGNIFPMGNNEEAPRGHFIPVNSEEEEEEETVTLRTYSRINPIVVIPKKQINRYETPSQINEQSPKITISPPSKKNPSLATEIPIDQLSSKANRIIEVSTNLTESLKDALSNTSNTTSQTEATDNKINESAENNDKILYTSSSYQTSTIYSHKDVDPSPNSQSFKELLSIAHTVSSLLPLLPSVIANNAHYNNDKISGYSANITAHLLAMVHAIVTWARFPNDALHYRIVNLAYDTAYTNICIAKLKESLYSKNITEALAISGQFKPTAKPQNSQQKAVLKILEIIILPILQTICSIATTSEDVKIRRIAEGCGTCIKLYTGYKISTSPTNKRTQLLALIVTMLVLTHELSTFDQIIEYKKSSPVNKESIATIDSSNAMPSKKTTVPLRNEDKDFCCRETSTDICSSVERATQTSDFYLFSARDLSNEFNQAHISELRKENASVPIGTLTPSCNRTFPFTTSPGDPVVDKEVASYTTSSKSN